MRSVVKNNYTEVRIDSMYGKNGNYFNSAKNERVVKNTKTTGLKADRIVTMLGMTVVKNTKMEVGR